MSAPTLRFWILNEAGEPEVATDLLSWGQWCEDVDRTVAKDVIGEALVSTVFLGVNHAFDDGPPVLWETMVFGGALDGVQWRYRSLKDAVAGHARAIAQVLERPAPD